MLTNGFPKSGNHALVKACELLGIPAEVQHRPYETGAGPCLFIKRDPRNILVSWLRFHGKEVTPGMFLSAFRYFQEDTLIAEMAAYEGWLSDRDTLVVSFESLIASPVDMIRIAARVGVPYLGGAWDHLPGLTRTWHAVHSDYRDIIWTPDVRKAWDAEGGGELLARWGYYAESFVSGGI